MRTMRPFLLALLLTPTSAAAQERCEFDVTGGNYIVMAGDSAVSEHTTERRALHRAAVLAMGDPSLVVTYRHEPVRVRAVGCLLGEPIEPPDSVVPPADSVISPPPDTVPEEPTDTLPELLPAPTGLVAEPDHEEAGTKPDGTEGIRHYIRFSWEPVPGYSGRYALVLEKDIDRTPPGPTSTTSTSGTAWTAWAWRDPEDRVHRVRVSADGGEEASVTYTIPAAPAPEPPPPDSSTAGAPELIDFYVEGNLDALVCTESETLAPDQEAEHVLEPTVMCDDPAYLAGRETVQALYTFEWPSTAATSYRLEAFRGDEAIAAIETAQTAGLLRHGPDAPPPDRACVTAAGGAAVCAPVAPQADRLEILWRTARDAPLIEGDIELELGQTVERCMRLYHGAEVVASSCSGDEPTRGDVPPSLDEAWPG